MWGRWLSLMWQMSQNIYSIEHSAKYPGSPLMCLLLFKDTRAGMPVSCDPREGAAGE